MLRENPRALNFNLACAAVLQKYDAEHDESLCKRIAAAAWGGETKDTVQPSKQLSTNGRARKQSMTDLMRDYEKRHG